MKKETLLFISIIMMMSFPFHGLLAQDTTGTDKNTNIKSGEQQFIDKNGDGYNDNAPDHDGDGIPNGLDSDWQKLKENKNKKRLRFIDLDGDGINDNLQNTIEKQEQENNVRQEQRGGGPLENQAKKGGEQKQNKQGGKK
jgi:hypothetical protein